MKNIILLLLVILGFQIGYGQTETKVFASNGDSFDEMGTTVAMSGSYAIAGAPGDEVNGADSGSAYIYELSGSWSQKTNITPSDAAANDEFGSSVAIDGNFAVVGAPLKTVWAGTDGAAYVFERDANGTWSQHTKLIGTALDQFGTSVAIDGDYIAVGGLNGGLQTGSVFIFYNNNGTWTQQAVLTPSNGLTNDEFGKSVAIDGNKVIVGAWGADVSGISDAGAAYIFSRSGTTWTEDAILTASDKALTDNFGGSVDISGNRAVVGAFNDDDAGSASGSAYIFHGSGTTWSQNYKAVASDATLGANFGYSVQFVTSTDIVIGAQRHRVNPVAPRIGAAYLFQYVNDAWGANSTTSQIIPSDGANYDYFGGAVAGSGDNIFVGAFREDAKGSNSGSGYFYDVGSVLPVRFESFTAKQEDRSSVLEWTTASETNNKGFEIQRSRDGIQWDNIGWVDGNGNSSSISHYDYYDEKPLQGLNYYRLKQIDYDGKFEFSSIVSVDFFRPFDFSVYPNPTSDVIYLDVDYSEDRSFSVRLYDTMARLVRYSDTPIEELSLAGLHQGYYLMIVHVDGRDYHQKIYKK